MKPKALRVDLWVPEVCASTGGIQVFSAHLIRAIAAIIGEGNLRIFSKNDYLVPDWLGSGTKFQYSGQWPEGVRSAAFAGKALLAGMSGHPDLVITTHLNFGVAARILKQWRGVPYWCVAHGIEAWGLSRADRIRGLREAERVLAVSSYTRQRVLEDLALPEGQVDLLANTFVPDRFQPGPKPEYLMERHGIPAGRKIILTVARLAEPERYKGYDKVLDAMRTILGQVPEAHYVLVGKGPDEVRIRSMISQLGLEGRVTLTGFVPDSELADYYNLCDVFAMPSQGEGFGIVYLEALACGKPVLAGNRDGAVDPLAHGELGVLVDPDDASAIGNALAGILKGTWPLPIIYQPEELRARVIARFGISRFEENVTRLLEAFAMRKGAGR